MQPGGLTKGLVRLELLRRTAQKVSTLERSLRRLVTKTGPLHRPGSEAWRVASRPVAKTGPLLKSGNWWNQELLQHRLNRLLQHREW